MRKTTTYISIAVIIVAITVIGALLTPLPQAAVNPYIVGGELEVPKETPSTSSTANFIPFLVTIVAVAIGVSVALRQSKTR